MNTRLNFPALLFIQYKAIAVFMILTGHTGNLIRPFFKRFSNGHKNLLKRMAYTKTWSEVSRWSGALVCSSDDQGQGHSHRSKSVLTVTEKLLGPVSLNFLDLRFS